MPVETYRGPALAPLIAQAEATFGANAVILETRQVRDPQGRRMYELVATDSAGAAQQVRAETAKATVAAPPVELVRQPSRGRTTEVIAFVGPTGAGKTTMIAKLASHAEMFGTRRVGLLCLDTYRVGAVEQLTAYADARDLALEVAYDLDDIAGCMKRLAGCDVVLIDCPGRSPKQQQDTDAVRAMLHAVRPTEVHGVLPAGLRNEHAKRLIEAQRGLGLTHLCVTKLDEFPDDWALFDLAAAMQLPMRWLGDGQSVPQDVRSAAARLDAARAHLGARRLHGEGIVA